LKLTVILKAALAPVVDAMKRTKSAIVTPESRGSAPQTQVDGAVEGLQVSRNPASLIKNLDFLRIEHEQVIVRQQNLINKLTEKSNHDDAIINRIDNKITAIEVPEMFREDVSRKNFVDRLLQSNEVSKSLSLCPHARGGGTFEGLSESYASNVIQTMADIAIKVAQLLLPKDAKEGAASLLRRMSDNPKFKRFALPNSDDSSKSYEDWTKNPVVNSIKGALEALGRKTRRYANNSCRFLVGIQSHGFSST
jgi:hypothetical protein